MRTWSRTVGVLGLLLAGLLGTGAALVRAEPPAPPSAVPAPAPGSPVAPVAAFPASWRGHWKGPARLVGETGTRRSFQMELLVEPTEIPGRWTWTVIYDGTAGRQVRPYFLVEQDAAKGTFVIDEGNGILLGAQLLDGSLFGQFAVGTSRITTRDRLEAPGTADERLEVELVTTIEDEVSLSGGSGGVPPVRSWPVRSLQTATLRRAAPTPATTPR